MTTPAVRCGGRERPLTELTERAGRLAAGLSGLGIGHGDRYAIVMRNEIAFLEASLAASAIGAVPVPVNWHRTGADVRVRDASGEAVPPGVPGIIYGRSVDGWPDFTYIGLDDKRREIERDGYITVGDIGYLDENGFLYLSDRVSDMVISGGVNIYPAEIEACLLRLDGVCDVAVFGIPDEHFGEALAAHVQLLPGAQVTENDVRDFVAGNLARYKVPKVAVFDGNLPREDTGKLFKRKFRAHCWPER
jgi:long-chain acyl-CoA synthetase